MPGASVLKAQYRAQDQGALTDNHIRPHLRIVNTGASSVPLSELALRYWYTCDSGPAQAYDCDWAVVSCANVSATIVPLATPRDGADCYLEVRFTAGAGSIAPGGNSGEIQSRIHKNDWSNYDEHDDYSFDGTKTSFADWVKVTLYRNGVLVWGVEP